MSLNAQRNSRTVGEVGLSTETFTWENGWQQITEASSPVGGQSSKSYVSEVVESVVSETSAYMFSNEVTIGYSLVKTWFIWLTK
jgi:hypothetical protein